MAAGAILTPILAAGYLAKGHRRGQRSGGESVGFSIEFLVWGLIGLTAAGAFAGFALGMKDIIRERRAAGHRVALPLRVLFGGVGSLLLIWIPLVVFGALVVASLTW